MPMGGTIDSGGRIIAEARKSGNGLSLRGGCRPTRQSIRMDCHVGPLGLLAMTILEDRARAGHRPALPLSELRDQLVELYLGERLGLEVHVREVVMRG